MSWETLIFKAANLILTLAGTIVPLILAGVWIPDGLRGRGLRWPTDTGETRHNKGFFASIGGILIGVLALLISVAMGCAFLELTTGWEPPPALRLPRG